MSDFDRNVAARGSFAGRAAAVDAGLRAHMIRVYNYMTVAVALTGTLVSVATSWTDVPSAALVAAVHGGALAATPLYTGRGGHPVALRARVDSYEVPLKAPEAPPAPKLVKLGKKTADGVVRLEA